MKLNSITKVDRGTNILDIHVPKELERTVKTGLGWFDELFGGEGLTPSQAILFTGSPGAGKTTTSLQVADSLTKAGHICLYNTGEESLLQVRKTAKRLNITNGFIVGSDILVGDIMLHLEELRSKNKNKQVFFICDSLQTLDDGKYANGHTNSMTQVRAVELLTDYCKEKYAIGIFIGHVTKSEEFAGKMQIKHTVDSHVHLGFDRDKKSETYGKRLMKCSKNRFGPAGIAFVMDMHADGLVALDRYDLTDE